MEPIRTDRNLTEFIAYNKGKYYFMKYLFQVHVFMYTCVLGYDAKCILCLEKSSRNTALDNCSISSLPKFSPPPSSPQLFDDPTSYFIKKLGVR